MKSAILTGANGFIGRAVCNELLSCGVKVTAIVRKEQSMQFLKNTNLEIVEAEMDDYIKLKDILAKDQDVFYHFAWDGAYGKEMGDYRKQIRNIEYTCNAVCLAEQIRCKKFIFAGTINELELLQFFRAENNKPREACIYGIAKLTCDLMGKTIAAQGKMDFNVAIIGSCFGPGDKSMRIHNTVIRSLMKGECPPLISGETLHDWIYIDDVAKMFRCLGEKSDNLKNYYLGHCKLRKLKEIISDVRDIVNPQVELTFGTIRSSFQIDYSLIDMEALYRDTGYEAKSDFKDSIKKTEEWLKRNDNYGE